MAPKKKKGESKPKKSAASLSSELTSVSQALKKAARKKTASAEETEHLRSRWEKLHNRLQDESRRLEHLAAKARVIEPPAPPPAGAQGSPVPPPKRGLFGPPSPKVEEKKDDKKNVGPQFRAFLTQIGEAMVDAQQKLDDQSRRYLAGPVPAAMPSMFRMPRLNAKVQFDFSESSGSDLNFVFYKKKQ